MKAQLFVFMLFNFAFAVTTLNGDISGRTFIEKEGPYIVEKDLLVSGKKATIIEEGCLFLFKSFTGIKVTGSLIVKGKKKSPVIFTSINNALFGSVITKEENDERSFDWNGIVIEYGAGEIILENFELSNSVFGLKSNTSKIVVYQGTFKDNGDFNFIIKDELLNVKEGVPYDYGIMPVTKKGLNNTVKIIGISSFSISAAVLSSMGWSFYRASLYQKKYQESKSTIQMLEYKKSKELYLKEATNFGIVGAAFFTIGLGSFICGKTLNTVSFFITPQEMSISLCKDI